VANSTPAAKSGDAPLPASVFQEKAVGESDQPMNLPPPKSFAIAPSIFQAFFRLRPEGKGIEVCG